MGEQDEKINLLARGMQHSETTARYNVFFGENRDSYDIRGRVAHETIFNVHNGTYRCPNTQQGYSPYTTWTRGLAWIFSGFAELLEYIDTLEESEFNNLVPELYADKQAAIERFKAIIEAVADFYLEHSTTDGIVYWDTGAPGLAVWAITWTDRLIRIMILSRSIRPLLPSVLRGFCVLAGTLKRAER